jgi:drug/metabolite transporter (DMT)-like permease
MVLITIAVLLRIFSNPLANVFQKQLTSGHHHPLLVNFMTYLLLSAASIPFIPFIPWKAQPVEFWIYSILGGITGALGNGFLIKALQKGDLSVLGPVNSYKSVVGVFIGIFLLGEIPDFLGLLGIALIIYGSYFVLDTTKERFTLALLNNIEIRFRILAMILTAVEAVFIKKVILTSSPSIAFISWCCFGALFSFLLYFAFSPNYKRELREKAFTDPGKYISLVFCIGTMQFTTNYVFKYIDVGYALSFFQLSIIASVLLGHRYFNERNIRKRLFGSAVMIAGSIIIIMS